ncbi:MAG: response regulator transcription factor [Oscillochloris sp.]|nr:response regulator transcription factor [Oscillochloris sp.]
MALAKILIADDEQDMVWAVRYTLIAEGYEVLTASNGVEAITIAQSTQPDLIILDIMMPHIDGFQVCHILRRDQHLASVPILFLSKQCSITDRIAGLDDGADDYLGKPFDFGELKARLRALLRRTGQATVASDNAPAILSYADLRLDLRTHQVITSKATVLLTPAEFDLLRHFLSHQGEIFSSQQLLQLVWNHDPDSCEHGLVRWHIMNLRAKIEPDNSVPTYLRTVPRHGYIMGDTTN